MRRGKGSRKEPKLIFPQHKTCIHLTTYISSFKKLYFLIIFSSLKIIIFLASKWNYIWKPPADQMIFGIIAAASRSVRPHKGDQKTAGGIIVIEKKICWTSFLEGGMLLITFFMWQYWQYCRTKASQPESTLPFPWVTIIQWFDFQKPCLSIELTLYRQISKFCHNFLSQL